MTKTIQQQPSIATSKVSLKKCLVFDSGPIITLTMNGVLWILEEIKKQYGGEFIIPQSVKEELIDKSLSSKKFQFEAYRLQEQIEKGVIKVVKDPKTIAKAKTVLDMCNSLLERNHQAIRIVSLAEVEAVVMAKEYAADAVVIDERTMRKLIEKPSEVQKRIERKTHMPIHMNNNIREQLETEFAGIQVLRSIECILVAYKMKLLDRYLSNKDQSKQGKRKNLLSAILWAIKLRGASITADDINYLVKTQA